ncbi:MAG: DUF503 domain-containing protein [Candidatus Latescibacterota bacterium]|nr:MAG: DUF503 domain-containing protein [Candidatus Latescibacterota bacterium]
MIVASLRVEILLPGCASLKQKRFVLASLKARLRNRFNVSVCENDFQDKWQRSELAVAAAATDMRGARTVSDQVLEFLEREPRIVLCGHERNFY